MNNNQNSIKDFIKDLLLTKLGHVRLVGDKNINFYDLPNRIEKDGYDFVGNGFCAGNTITVSNTALNNGTFTIHSPGLGVLYVTESITGEEGTSAVIDNGNIFRMIGELPEDTRKVGKNYPCALFFDGDESIDSSGSLIGRRITYYYSFGIYVIHNAIVDRISLMNQICESVIETILGDLSCGGYAVIVRYSGTEKGGVSSGDIDYQEPGYYSNITIRKINFEAEINDSI